MRERSKFGIAIAAMIRMIATTVSAQHLPSWHFPWLARNQPEHVKRYSEAHQYLPTMNAVTTHQERPVKHDLSRQPSVRPLCPVFPFPPVLNSRGGIWNQNAKVFTTGQPSVFCATNVVPVQCSRAHEEPSAQFARTRSQMFSRS
jgi:hypothetical protein